MFPSILYKYLFKELMGPFIFGVAAFTAILVAGSALFEIIRLISQYPNFLIINEIKLEIPILLIFNSVIY